MAKTMQGIDISSWQAGIPLSKVKADFVVVKATQGTGYTSPCFKEQCEAALAAGRLLGCYHYVSGGGAAAEAKAFVSAVQKYVGRAVLAIDWESGENAAWGDLGYLRTLVSEVIRLTGVKPLVYASYSVFPWDVAKELDCGAWVAQYGSDDATGYQASPWNEGAYACAVRQYSSNGRLSGWAGGLDLDKAYMSAAAWRKYAQPAKAAKSATGGKTGKSSGKSAGTSTKKTSTATEKAKAAAAAARKKAAAAKKKAAAAKEKARIDKLARKAIRGDYGNGEARRKALGKDYAAVQKRVNELLK